MRGEVGGGRIVLRDVGDGILHRVVSLPGVLFDRRLELWTVPATPGAARAVSVVGGELTGEGARLLEIFSRRREKIQSRAISGDSALWRHQREALAVCEDPGGILLWHGMSAGKTRTTLELVRQLGYRRVLVLAPKFVVPAWAEQGERWGVSVTACSKGTVRERTAVAEESTSSVVVIGHAASHREPFRSWALAKRWDLVVVDEVQHAKSAGGVFSKFVTKFGTNIPHRIGLSGTPMPHSRLDAYGIMRFLDSGLFGTSSTKFRLRYAEEIPLPGCPVKKIIGWKNTEDFDRRFWSITHHVPREALDLPAETDTTRSFPLTGEPRRIYNQLAKDGLTEGVAVHNVLTKMLRLQQVASGFLSDETGIIRTLHDGKAELLAEVLEELAQDEPVVIFARFHEDLNVIHQVCKAMGRKSLELSGRANDLESWQSGSGVVLAVQIQAGGVGIDLTRACHAIYYSLGWSLGDYLQSRARISRTNQKRPCSFVHLLCEVPAERALYAALRNKQEAVDEVLKHPEEWLGAA